MLAMLAILAILATSGSPAMSGVGVHRHKSGSNAHHSCSDGVFRFQVNFWVNLHLFLRAEARRRHMGAATELVVNDLSPRDKEIWLSSLAVYDSLARKSVLDPGVTSITDALSEASHERTLASPHVPFLLRAALRKAAPIYDAHLWSSHRAEDEAWIDEHCRDVRRYDRATEVAVARAFDLASPRKPILVDLARETGPNLAYTAAGLAAAAGHTVLAPQQTAGRHLALSTIFHEISHTMDDAIIALVNREAERQHVSAPPDLWHAITLYTTSVITQDQLERGGQSATDVLTDRIALFQRSHWDEWLRVLDREWRPHLEGKTSLSSALAATIHQTSKNRS
jgi:hypothetical protein